MTNPYQAFFDKLDQTVVELDAQVAEGGGAVDETWPQRDAADLLRRAAFVLANLVNVNAQTMPMLVLPVEGEAEVVDQDPSNQSPGTT